MEKAERETHDFMNVDSFSQLPFIRPAPAKEKGIRLFGIEFGGDVTITDESESVETNTTTEEPSKGNDNNNNNNNNNNTINTSDTGRKFECHYCCRNFPTSQALGGHQNAHKRERQHAKRAHLHSTMALNSITEGHMYGLVNYRSPPTLATAYPSWNNTSHMMATSSTASAAARFYRSHAGLQHPQPPINGSPLAIWRIPAVQSTPSSDRDRLLLPLFAGDEDHSKTTNMGGPSSHNLHVFENRKPSVHDHMSLDLHL